MKTLLLLYALLSGISLGGPYLGPLMIYGKDQRQFVRLDSRQNCRAPWCQSDWRSRTVGMVPAGALRTLNGRTYIKSESFKDIYEDLYQAPFCKGHRFEDRSIYAHCSGFFIGPGLIMTAAHCLGKDREEASFSCQEYRWVVALTSLRVSPQQVFRCDKIVYFRHHPGLKDFEDIAIIKTRPTSHRPISLGTRKHFLYSLGHPFGLPLMASWGRVLPSPARGDIFYSSLDSAEGMSGSAVIDAQSHDLVGLYITGRKDFFLDESRQCLRVSRCSNDVDNCNTPDTFSRGELIQDASKLRGALKSLL